MCKRIRGSFCHLKTPILMRRHPLWCPPNLRRHVRLRITMHLGKEKQGPEQAVRLQPQPSLVFNLGEEGRGGRREELVLLQNGEDLRGRVLPLDGRALSNAARR